MSVADFDAQYGGYGIPSVPAADSGAVTVSASPHVTTLTVPANADGTQPTVKRGKLVVSLSALNTAAVLGQIDIAVSDGAGTEYVDSIPAPGSAIAGQGMSLVRDIFTALINVTTIKTVTIRTTTTVNNNYTKQCRFLGERN